MIDTEREFIEQSDSLKILYLNAQSLRNKATLLNDMIHELNIDIAFFTESWLKSSGDEVIIQNLTPEGFKAVSFHRESGHGGGICIVHRESMTIDLKRIRTFHSFECCECNLTIKKHTISFICIYRPPPNKKNKLTTKGFIAEFHDLLDSFIKKRWWPILLGDFNLHWDVPSDPDVTAVRDILNTHGLHQVIDQPTHIKNHILDWLITDSLDNVHLVHVQDKCLSDHKAFTFEMPCPKPIPTKRSISGRKLETINNEKFKRDLENIIEDISTSTTKSALEQYNAKLIMLLDQHAPLKTRIVTDRPSAEWMNLDIKQAKAERRRAERRWRQTKLSVHRDIFRLLNHKVKDLIDFAKKCLYNKQIEECSTSKKLFHVTNHLSGKGGNVLPNNIPVNELPQTFGKFFNDKISQIRQGIDNASLSPPSYTEFQGECLSDFRCVTEEEVRSIIISSPPKSCCLDPIPTPLLMKHLDSTVGTITSIINESLSSGSVPDSFKHAVVRPLLKKQNMPPNELKNYRPVSNLPFLSKILEKVVLSQLKGHLLKYNLLDSHQSAYREFHNTETALLKVHNDLLCAADKNDISILALLDLSAAFDTIDHHILLERLRITMGLSGTVLSWFESYVTGRSQSVIVNCLQSSIFDVQFGVPQGSVLGPVLYTLYTTPLGKIIKEHNINYHMYADDTQLYKSVPFSDLQLLVQSIETCSGNVKKWMTDNKLKMNNEKTEILLCGPKKYVESSDCDHICIEGENISFADNARNLGVYFDCTFSMEHHVKQLCKSLFFELRKISHMRAFLNEASLQKLITSFVLSRMDYCNSLLVNLPNDTITKLQRIQNHAARLVLKKTKRDHVTPLFRKLHWLPLQARIDYKICVLCFKCINKTAPSYLSDLLEQYVPSRLLRSGSQNLLKIPPRANKKCTEKAFKHCAPYIWNSLPSDIREAKSESQFKNYLKTHLFKSHLCI